jgi:cytochrome c-type biogenesis protein
MERWKMHPLALLAMLQTGSGGGFSEVLAGNPLMAIAVLFGAGLVTSLNPCIYPMIPITASVISGTAQPGQGRGRTVGLTLVYALGMGSIYAVLGLIAGMTGTIFGTISANPWALFGVGNLLLLFALFMLDVIPVPVPRGLLEWASRRQGGSYGAVFVLGAGSGVVMAPCGAPAFAAVLTWVAATQAGALGFAYLLSFSLGMTGLIVAVGISSGFAAALPKSGAWMLWIKRLGALVLIGMAEYYLLKAGYGM